MVSESILTTFTHEYGHAQYRVAHPNDFQEVDSEIAAIKSSLTILPSEGFEYLAYREASAFKGMARDEPYQARSHVLQPMRCGENIPKGHNSSSGHSLVWL
jgi:hypothetical protein